MSSHPLMVNPRQLARALVFALLLSLLFAASVSMAYGQQFTLTVSSGLAPASVDPGGSSVATLSIGGSGNPVLFDTVPCTVTPVQPAGTPQCAVSPDSVTPPGQAFLTISTGTNTPPGLYTISVTGTSGSVSQAVTLTLNVVNVSQNYSLIVSPVTATPSPVPAGSIATTIVTVNPIAAYTGTITLACYSISPVVAAPPYCSFAATNGSASLPPDTVQVTGGVAATATLTITTLGPTSSAGLRNRPSNYAFWLLLPGLALVGMAVTGVRGKNLLGAFLLIAVAGGLLLMPACGTPSTVTNNAPNGAITPKNTYTFTLTGADQTGAAPSNAPTSGSPVTVTLAVN